MGECITQYFLFIIGIPSTATSLWAQAWTTTHKGLRPHTRSQYIRQFRSFLAFVIAQNFQLYDKEATIMCFLQFLASNSLSFRVINNYVSALKFYFVRYAWDIQVFDAPLVRRMLRGLQYSIRSVPTSKGLFMLQQLREISQLCESFESTLTYRAAYLLAFYGLFRISNLAPKSSVSFDASIHLL